MALWCDIEDHAISGYYAAGNPTRNRGYNVFDYGRNDEEHSPANSGDYTFHTLEDQHVAPPPPYTQNYLIFHGYIDSPYSEIVGPDIPVSAGVFYQNARPPWRIPQLDRDFLVAGGATVALARATASAALYTQQVQRWAGYLENMPGGYTQTGAGFGGVGPHNGRAYATGTLLGPLTPAGSITFALIGVDLGNPHPRNFVAIGAVAVTMTSGISAAVNLTAIITAYLANKNSYSAFEFIPRVPLPGEDPLNPTPSLKGLLDSGLQSNLTWDFGTDDALWLPFGTESWTDVFWNNLSIGGLAVKFGGAVALPTAALLTADWPPDMTPLP